MMEKILPLLCLLLSSVAAENCSYSFERRSYAKTVVLTIKGLPTNLALTSKTELLFTLIDIESLHDDNVQTKMDQYIIKNAEPIKIDNVKGQAAAVDGPPDKIYIATDDGITILNKDNEATFFAMKDDDIVQLFKPNHKSILYATLFPDNELYTLDLQTQEKTKIENVPCAYFMAVDDNDNIYYECNSKYVKVLRKGFQEPIEFVGLPKNAGRAIAIGPHGKVILAANDGLYLLNPDNMIPDKLMDLDMIPAGIVFDRDEFYISTSGVIYKFSPEHCPQRTNLIESISEGY